MIQGKTIHLFVFAAAMFAAAEASAETMLFDFETEADAAALKACHHYGLELSASGDVAMTGQRSLSVTSKKYVKGGDQWPAFNLTPAVADWTGFDRLCVSMVNPAIDTFTFAAFVTDSKHKVQDGLSYRFEMPTVGYRQYVIPLNFPAAIDGKDIKTIHFFLTEVPQDVAFYIDSISLLKAGEPVPERTAMMPYLVRLSAKTVETARASLAALKKDFSPAAGDPAEDKLLAQRLAPVADDIAAAAEKLQHSQTPADLEAFQAVAGTIGFRIAWLRSYLVFAKACAAANIPADTPYLLGIAPPTQRVAPKSAFRLTPATEASVDLARNEKESVQIAVVPNAVAIKGMSCAVSVLSGPGGASFPASAIDCDVMGYVRTDGTAPYATPEVMQWWPDPILGFLKAVDIAPETAQTFWIRVRAPKEQPAGTYRGTLTFKADGLADRTLPFTVRVRDFTLPDVSPLPLAITFSPEDNPIETTRARQAEWKKSPDYPVNLWRTQKTAWADFLADYYITMDSLYHHGDIDFDLLMRLNSQNRLGNFNLRYWHYFDDDEKSRADWKGDVLASIKKNYDRAKELGILGHAYIYGCDEIPQKHFSRIKEATDLIRAACPGVPLLTTAYDETYGLDSELGAMDGFCPLTPKYDSARAQNARAHGKQVWWYICCGPSNPHANAFIEYDPSELRLLMGAMTAKERPDGFLYYQISIWNSAKPITGGPFTDWDARSWTLWHGDGAWTCVGPGGKPVPTQRLENFRDGLEDYAYVRELERHLAVAPPDAYVWQAAAKGALAVPTNIVESMTVYNRDGAALLAWRAKLADLIESAPRKQ